MAEERLPKKAVQEYHESAGQVIPDAPEAGDTTTADAAPEVKAPEVKAEQPAKKSEQKKDAKSDSKADATTDAADPHAENHRKALQEARAELREFRKRTEEESKSRETKHAELQRKFDEFVKAVQAPPPSREAQPFEYLEHKNKALEDELAQIKTWREETQRNTQAKTDQQKLNEFVTNASMPFLKETTDYADAYQYAMELKEEELRLAGMPEEQIAPTRMQWEQSFAVQALRAQKSPAQQLYAYAQRLGYKKKEAAASGQSPADAKLENIQRGQDAAKTLNGGGAETEFSLSMLEQMSDEQIRQLAKDPKKWMKAAGQFH